MKSIGLKLKILLAFTAIIGLTSCEKYDKDIEGDVNFYLLKEYDTKLHSAAIFRNGLVLESDPILSYDEIEWYNSKTHSYKINQTSVNRLKELWGSAFAVTVDSEVIYTGYFWSGLSSAIVDWIVVDVLTIEMKEELIVERGYPGMIEDWDIPDLRNDNRLLSVFARDKKLRD